MSYSKKIIACLSLLLVGCASPLVKYGPAPAEDEKGLAKFSFSESVIKFSFKRDSSLAANIAGIDINSVPVPERSGKRYFIAGTSAMENWGVTTEVVPAYRADTPLLQSVSTTVTDQRISYIEKAGGILTKLAGMVVSSEEWKKEKLPDGIYMQPYLNLEECAHGCEKDVAFPETPKFNAKIKVGTVPADSFERRTRLDSVYKSGAFVYSACREVNVILYLGKERVAESNVMVADSKSLQTLAFPNKGKVTAGATCGATSSAEDAGLPNALDFIDALIAQAQAVAKK